jgi:hypothetical protein
MLFSRGDSGQPVPRWLGPASGRVSAKSPELARATSNSNDPMNVPAPWASKAFTPVLRPRSSIRVILRSRIRSRIKRIARPNDRQMAALGRLLATAT